MSHGSAHGDPVELTGQHIGCRRSSCDERRARRLESRVRAVISSQRIVDELTVAACDGHSRGLRRDHRLEGDAVHEEALDDLSLDDRCRHSDEGLGCEDGLPLGHSPYLSGEAETPEERQELVGEEPERAEIGERVVLEPEVLEVPEGLLEPTHHQEVALLGKLTDEEVNVAGPFIPFSK